jgi:ADP-ribose pyrophosphatase YjhB (NUDIX family)
MGEKSHKKRILRKDVVSGNSCHISLNKENGILLINYLNKKTNTIEKRIPGGKWECGETTKDALRRELSEELGIVIKNIHCLGQGRSLVSIDDNYRDDSILVKKYHQRDVYYSLSYNWEFNEVLKEQSVYKDKCDFYPIDQAWQMIGSTQRELFANGLFALFYTNRKMKKLFPSVWQEILIFHKTAKKIDFVE